MNFIRTEIPDVIICEPRLFQDGRGYFFESFNQLKFEEFLNKKINFCQDNESKSSYGVLRGIHFQKPPYAQAKLVRVIKGKVLDVVVDLRKNSKTFGKTFSIELSEENKKQLFIPRGFGHGFVVLEDDTIFTYKVDNMYDSDSESGVMYNDFTLNIDWKVPIKDLIISDKDKKNNTLKAAYVFQELEL